MVKINFRSFTRILSVSAFALIFGVYVFAQTAPPPESRLSANENFDLNITTDRITETNFARSTAVELTDANRGNVSVEVGVGVRAERIDVLLRGVFGRVTFRGSLESIRRRIEQNRAPAAQTAP